MSNVGEQGVEGGRGRGVDARGAGAGDTVGVTESEGEGKQTPPLAFGAREGVAFAA